LVKNVAEAPKSSHATIDKAARVGMGAQTHG
jgi:hypothetical protein